MFVTINDELRVVSGTVQMNSAFRSKNKQVRMQAHRTLIEAMVERGWQSNGRKRLELPTFNFRPGMNPDQICGKLLASVQELTNYIQDPKEFPERSFWQHEVTGQIIYVDDLMAATSLWPMWEVLQLVDSVN